MHALGPPNQLLKLPGPELPFNHRHILELQVIDRVKGRGSCWIGLSQTQQFLDSSGHSSNGRILPEEGGDETSFPQEPPQAPPYSQFRGRSPGNGTLT